LPAQHRHAEIRSRLGIDPDIRLPTGRRLAMFAANENCFPFGAACDKALLLQGKPRA
jgi:hypothetical protein